MANTYHSKQDVDDITFKFLETNYEPTLKNLATWIIFWKTYKIFPPILGNHILTHRPMLLVCATLPYFLQSMLYSDRSYLKGFKYLSKVLPVNESISFLSAIKIIINAWETSVH